MTLTPPPRITLNRSSLQLAADTETRCNLHLTRKLVAVCRYFLYLSLLDGYPLQNLPKA
jgi:hypothetical protein